MIISYIRVSTAEQHEDRQLLEIKGKYPDIKDKYIFFDKQTGKNFDRPEYQRMKSLIELLDGDGGRVELVIHELDRLGRNKALIKEELAWFQAHGVVVRILNLPTTLIDFTDDTAGILDMVHNILLEVLSTMAEAELRTRDKRQREGIEAAKAKGVYKGRQRVKVDMESFTMLYKLWKDGKVTASKAMKHLNLKPNTFYRRVKEYEGDILIDF
jgi:DNA invertase Pin-like site-specific DNA recombinase